MKISPLLSALGVCLAVAVDTQAATHNASSCNGSAVNSAINAASHGDTVVVPAGTCTWNSQVVVTKGITLMGAGIDRTILVDNVPKDGSGESSLIVFQVNAPNRFRFTGFTVRGQAPDPNSQNKSHVRAVGTTKAFRIDHIKFENMQTGGIHIDGDMWGVVDHCEFHKSFKNGVIVSHSGWGGAAWGDGSWADQLYLGTERAVYVEDNTFHENANPFAGAVNDCFDGGRIVYRYNTSHDDFFQVHGTESSQRRRGCRSFEVYNNTFYYNGSLHTASYIRSGTGVFFNNTYTNPNPGNGNPSSGFGMMLGLFLFRAENPYTPWGKCDGSSPYDQNSSGQSGYRCVDQPGAGTSRHLNGADVPNAQWVGNQLDPIYQWNNNFGGSTNHTITSNSGHVRAGRDYFDNQQRPGYTPFVYPHPLVTGGSLPEPPPSGAVPPTAPVNIRIIR